jgi:hypothetical protein
LETIFRTDSTCFDLFDDVQQTGTLLSRITSTNTNKKTSKVNDYVFAYNRSIIEAIFCREFSDCAIGVLDKSVEENETRIFEMLQMQYPVLKHKVHFLDL